MNFDDLRRLSFKDVGNWPLLPKLLVLGALFAAIIAAGALLDWKDQYETLERAEAEEGTLRTQYTEKKAKAINFDACREQLAEVEQSFGALVKQLPNRSEIDALLTDINQAGLGRGLQFELNRNFHGGWVLRSNYTLSENRGNVFGNSIGTNLNQEIIADDLLDMKNVINPATGQPWTERFRYGRGPSDRLHVLNIAGAKSWNLTDRQTISVGGFYYYRTGQPWALSVSCHRSRRRCQSPSASATPPRAKNLPSESWPDSSRNRRCTCVSVGGAAVAVNSRRAVGPQAWLPRMTTTRDRRAPIAYDRGRDGRSRRVLRRGVRPGRMSRTPDEERPEPDTAPAEELEDGSLDPDELDAEPEWWDEGSDDET